MSNYNYPPNYDYSPQQHNQPQQGMPSNQPQMPFQDPYSPQYQAPPMNMPYDTSQNQTPNNMGNPLMGQQYSPYGVQPLQMQGQQNPPLQPTTSPRLADPAPITINLINNNEQNTKKTAQVYSIAPTNLDRQRTPTQFKCPMCQHESVSVVRHEPGSGTYLLGCILCVFFGPVGLIPCFVGDCQDTKHFCPVCGNQVGVAEYKPY